MKTRFLLPGMVAGLAALLVWTSFFWNPVPPKEISRPAGLAAPPVGGDFTLLSASGPVSLQHYRGKAVLLYFGYTFCPDVCPTSLAILAQALSGLSDSERERVQALFVSVDPERDSLERLKEYAPFFHPAILGITGSAEEIASVATRYGASYSRQPSDANGQYAVDHSSVTYLIAPDGKLVASLPHATPAPQIVEAVRALLR